MRILGAFLVAGSFLWTGAPGKDIPYDVYSGSAGLYFLDSFVPLFGNASV